MPWSAALAEALPPPPPPPPGDGGFVGGAGPGCAGGCGLMSGLPYVEIASESTLIAVLAVQT